MNGKALAMGNMTIKKILLIFVWILCIGHAFASEQVVTVGVPVSYPPYSYIENGEPAGLSIDIWQRIAEDNHIQYRYVILNRDMQQHYLLLGQHKLDVLLGPVSVEPKMIGKIEYSIPYFIDGIDVLLPTERLHFKDLFSGILKDYLLYTILGYFLIFLLYIHLVWLIERGCEVPNNYFAGIYMVFNYHISFSDHFFEKPRTKICQTMYVFWYYLTFIFLTIVAASITSALTVMLDDQHTSLFDEDKFIHKKFAYMSDRPMFKNFVEERKLDAVPAGDMEAALAMLNSHEVEGIINDDSIFATYLKEHPNKNLVRSPYSLGYVFFHFALSPKNHLATVINASIAKIQQNGSEGAICERYNIPKNKYCNFY